MRTALLIPLALLTAVVTGCDDNGSNPSERETAARSAAVPNRDLTLSVPQGPAAEVASAVELSLPRPHPTPTRRHVARPRPKPAPVPDAAPKHEAAAEPTPEPVSAPTVTVALAEPAPLDDAVSGGRELAPGKTITLIPVSSGPSVEAEEGDSWVPSEPSRGVLVGGGGTCRRRGGGGGIGIAARFPVGIPTLRLR